MADKLITCVSQQQALFDKRQANNKDNDLRQHMAECCRSVGEVLDEVTSA